MNFFHDILIYWDAPVFGCKVLSKISGSQPKGHKCATQDISSGMFAVMLKINSINLTKIVLWFYKIVSLC